jgi:RluA family pseudouridine synthase
MSIHKERILYEDEHLIIVHKLAGELVVAASGEGKLPLFDFLQKQYPGLRVLHRLDFGTSGAIAFARNAEVVRKVRETKFAGWKKVYKALVTGRIPKKEGTITLKLPARTRDELVDAVTHYRILQSFEYATFVEVQIETGRKHQIRRHMASIGHPLILDPLFGNAKTDKVFKRKYGYGRFFLHAASLSLPHPITGKIISVQAPLPSAFTEVLAKLR